jgi:hypothetical protein
LVHLVHLLHFGYDEQESDEEYEGSGEVADHGASGGVGSGIQCEIRRSGGSDLSRPFSQPRDVPKFTMRIGSGKLA